ncbi:hypothetical protein [Oceanidesulfovibrio marinus]|uniref:PsiF repeat-containing protein n=1 Tax=Oceanidesulfovibrio marinus TaxID=370038 RepID=A0A6P1ZLN3_9BACT|nr:hypothetical protein [Oceanidesulfovibrio marinus]QJT08897.1 hypothetical protein E8L03_08130 [Oceanidesulfovibrio marinus]TVM36682.1 hypothetical protein DQK91_01815 [Oceanidesulfovibrio marinus]
MRMPHLLLIVALFLGFVTLLAHQPDDDRAFAEEGVMQAANTSPAHPPKDVMRQCLEQARAANVSEQDMNSYMEQCAGVRTAKSALAE